MKSALYTLVAGFLVLECYARFGPELHQGRPSPSRLQSDSGFRLPKTARPNKYDLSLTFGLGGPSPFAAGLVTINLDVDAGNDNYTLKLNSKVTFEPDAVATWTKNKTVAFSCPITSHPPEYIEINCANNSIIGTNQTVTLQYTPYLSVDDLDGAYVSRFIEDGREKYIVATQFEQIGARRVFPSFDEPEFKAPISLTLINNNATGFGGPEWIANTKVASTDYQNGVLFTTFEDTPKMSTYLLAFVISQDFHNTTAPTATKDYEFSVFARKSADGYVNQAIKYGPQLISKMGEFTNLTYPDLGIKKMTLAAIPEFAAGAMENWGLITYRENYLIDEGDRTPERDIQSIASVIAHELTHQWFGDYVTTNWWSETWLNEGFAEYFEYYLTDQVLENSEMLEQLITKEQQPALKVDATQDTIPLVNNASDVTTQRDFSKEFGTISYSKGASIIKMIKYALGEDILKAGLNKYLTEHQYGNTTSENLVDALQSSVDAKKLTLNLTEILSNWIYQSGYPILDVSLDSDTNNVSLKATKFSSSLDKSNEKNESIWHIPLSFTTNDKKNFTPTFSWIAPEAVANYSISVPENGWLIVNLKSAGFYRVNYDETLWDRIIQVLNNNSYTDIDVVNRAQLLDDAFNIARSIEGSEDDQIQNYLRAFSLAEYLQRETEYHPWYTFFVEIQYLLDRIQDADTSLKLKEYVEAIISVQVEGALNLVVNATDLQHIQVLKNNLLLTWACKLGNEKCVEWANVQFEEYKKKKESIDNNYRDVIICTGLANSQNASEDYDLILASLNSSILPGEQNDLAKGLTCIRDADLINKPILDTLANNTFPRQLYTTIVSSLISDGPEKLISTLKTVLDNDLAINKKWRAIGTTEGLLATIAAKCFSNDCITTLKNDYLTNHEDDASRSSIVAAVIQAINTIETNLKWVEKYGDILTTVIVYDGEKPEVTTPRNAATYYNGQNVALLVSLVVSIFKMFYF